eukprot:scaffold741_cov303-Prasinococcus_capsulatus_cf.AAC.2
MQQQRVARRRCPQRPSRCRRAAAARGARPYPGVAGAVPPRRDGLLVEHAVGEGDDADAAGLEHAEDFREDGLGLLQVLHRAARKHRVEARVRAAALQGGQHGLLVEVAHEEAREAGITRQLLGVHAVAHHLAVLHLGRQVRHPGALQVQHAPARRDAPAVELRQVREELIVHVRHEARERVERRVVPRRQLAPLLRRQHLPPHRARLARHAPPPRRVTSRRRHRRSRRARRRPPRAPPRRGRGAQSRSCRKAGDECHAARNCTDGWRPGRRTCASAVGSYYLRPPLPLPLLLLQPLLHDYSAPLAGDRALRAGGAPGRALVRVCALPSSRGGGGERGLRHAEEASERRTEDGRASLYARCDDATCSFLRPSRRPATSPGARVSRSLVLCQLRSRSFEVLLGRGGGRRRALKCSAGTASSPDAGAARRMQCAGGGSAGALCQVHVPA